MALIETLADDFTTADEAKWLYEDAPNTVIVDGQVQVLIDDSLASVDAYDLTGSSFSVEVVTAAPGTWIGVVDGIGGTNGVLMLLEETDFAFYTADLSTLVVAGPTYDPVAHRFWRISEDAGWISFETSPDGDDWTTHETVEFPSSGCYAFLTFGVFDNVNAAAGPSAACYVGAVDLSALYVGTTPATKLYLGADLIWSAPPPAPTITNIVTSPFYVGDTITVSGTDFDVSTPTVRVDGVLATSVSVTNATTLTCVIPTVTDGVRDVTVTTHGGTSAGYSITIEFTFIAFTEENTARTNQAVPTGCAGCWVTLIGPGGGGGSGRLAGSGNRAGGGGGGGGAFIPRVYVPVASLGATYSVVVQTTDTAGGAQVAATANGNPGTTGSATSFVSGATNMVAGAGVRGLGGTTATQGGGAGGTVSGATGDAGTAGGNGGTTGSAATNNGTSASGGAGGGGGGGVNSGNTWNYGGVGGSTNGQAGGTSNPTTNGSAKTAGVAGSGGGGAKGSGGNAGKGPGYGAGGGGGQGNGSTINNENGGTGGPGYSKIEWV